MELKHQRFDLPDGRTMGFAVYGKADGPPVVVCHGTPGSRLMLQIAEREAISLGLRLIVPDRPGYGFSSPSDCDQVLDWAPDVIDLVDHLGLERFAVSGISGGGPYALAVAHALPDRVQQVQVISGMGPLNEKDVYRHLNARQRALTRAIQRDSLVLRAILKVAGKGLPKLPDPWLQKVLRLAPGARGPLSMNPHAGEAMAKSFRQAFCHGGGGLANDLALFSRPWGFSASEIAAPVQLWHGDNDDIVPVTMGRYLADRLQNCEATFIPGANHYWVVDNVDLILTTLKQRLTTSDECENENLA